MVTIASLWLTILLSAVIVWIASAIVWIALPHHKKDFSKIPNEDAARDALSGIEPGVFMLPYAADQHEFKAPEFLDKLNEGPVGYLTVVPNGPVEMGKKMVMSFFFYLLVGLVVAYLATQAVGAGAEYMDVFQFTSTAAWAIFGLAIIPDAVWFGRPWPQVVKHIFDAFLYGLLLGGVFGWMWP